jgi:cell division protein FtsI/penicillin-binding protein 2
MLQREELELLRRRITFITYVIIAALLVLTFGYWNAQVVQSGYYQQRAMRIESVKFRCWRRAGASTIANIASSPTIALPITSS